MKALLYRTVLLATLLAISSARAATLYVSAASASPAAPFTNWLHAAQTIQAAVDVAAPGDTVLVTNGLYATGGRVPALSVLTNRLVVDRAVTVRSVNGPAVTVIRGYQVPGATNGPAAVRCAYLANGASLIGFTLTNGATQAASGSFSRDMSGGGVWCASTNAMVSNCVVSGNAAYFGGGGAYQGRIENCTLTGNAALFGGGASDAALHHCTLAGNRSSSDGGGTYLSFLNGCLLRGNAADLGGGGGAFAGTLINCTVTGNSASYGGRALSATVNNSIIYYNQASTADTNQGSCTLNYSCTIPMPDGGIGNITNEPAFVNLLGNNLRLQAGSPCINAGYNALAAGLSDLDGRPRLIGASVDMGAYESQAEFTAWLAQYGLSTGGSADFTDADGDRLGNWQEYWTGTNPTNNLSFFRLLSPVRAGADVTVRWTSVTNRTYRLEWRTSLDSSTPFETLASSLPGQPSLTSYSHSGVASNPAAYYRVATE